MRVIAGEFGGRTLQAPAGQATRPTTEKVRQAVFNSLHSAGLLADARVADLYAGSGALGIEALSRGAASAVFVERDRAALTALRANLAALRLDDRARVVPSDVLAWVPAMRDIDIVFVDPPYSFDGWATLLPLVHAPLVVAESGAPLDRSPAMPVPGWDMLRSRRYGRTWVTVLERIASPSA
jgi:16S rRNA (guanine966-N2)-methyltransferase